MVDSPAKQRLKALEWIGVGTGVLALIASFLPWFSITGTFADEQRALGIRSWLSAWGSGFIGWLPVLLLVAAAALLIGKWAGRTVPMLASTWMTFALLAVVMILIRWATAMDSDLPAERVTWHTGWGLYLTLISAALSLLAAFLVFRSVQRKPAVS